MTVTKSKSLRLSRGHLHSAKCRRHHHSKNKSRRAHSRGGAKKKSRKSRKSRRGHSATIKKSRRGMRGGCWLTDMFSSKPTEKNVVQRAMNNQARVQQEIKNLTKKTQNYTNALNKRFQKKNTPPDLGKIIANYKEITEERALKQKKRKWARKTYDDLTFEERVNLNEQQPNVVKKWINGEADTVDMTTLNEILGKELEIRQFM